MTSTERAKQIEQRWQNTPEVMKAVLQPPAPKSLSAAQVARSSQKVTLQCNECGKKRQVSPNGRYNDRCPNCGGVDWDVL